MDKEQQAIERLKLGEQMSLTYYQKPLMICYSGGKDSEVLLELAKRAGIKYEVQHSHTTADAPETVYHVRKKFRELELAGVTCTINKPTYKGERVSMWTLIPQKLMPPTRRSRYCCQILKETAGKNRAIVTGVRCMESTGRSADTIVAPDIANKDKRIAFNSAVNIDESQETFYGFEYDNFPEDTIARYCKNRQKIQIKPILDWSSGDVWAYLRDCKVAVNPCYEYGFPRAGCVGCPIAGNGRHDEFRQWPEFKKMYINAFDQMLGVRRDRGLPTQWESGTDVYYWWMEDNKIDGQLEFDGVRIAI